MRTGTVYGELLFAGMQHMTSEAERRQCVSQICAILYSRFDDPARNLTSGHERDMARLPRTVRFGIICRFTGIVQFYKTHPVYGILFSARTNGDDPDSDDKIRIGMNEVALFLQKEGYGNPWSMNLTDCFDVQVQSLRDSIRSALASGAKLDEIARKTGLPDAIIFKLK